MSAARSETPCARVINSVAPIRICDNGGWTDTWFAGHGKVFNIGVYPYVEVQIEVLPRETQADRIVLYAENYGERFVVHPERPGYDRHPLLEAAFDYMAIPEEIALDFVGRLDGIDPVGELLDGVQLRRRVDHLSAAVLVSRWDFPVLTPPP